MIPRVAYILTLGAIAFVLLIGAAAEGLLDRLPPQPYFPSALAERRQVQCDPEGALWPEDIKSTDWKQPIIDSGSAAWFGNHLRSAQELSLSQPGGHSARTLRLTWLRSFHPTVIVRIDELTTGEMRLTAKRLSGRGGYSPGGIAAQHSRLLTGAETTSLLRLLDRQDVFSIIPVGCGFGVDGAEWILEARDPTRYHVALRWSPRGGAVHEIGTLLLGFTGWDLDPVY